LRTLISLRHIHIEDRAVALSALEAYGLGLDFADALRLARSVSATAFRTFDKRLARMAQRAGLTTPVEMLK
jgi:predicted nucleic-acid-binding protein